MDRADATGLGIAAVGHIALLAALILLVPKEPVRVPGAPSIEVSFEEEVGIVSAGETTDSSAPPTATEMGAIEDAAPGLPAEVPAAATPEPSPAPSPPQPTPRAQPQPPRPQPSRAPPQPPRPQPQQARQQQARPQPQPSRPAAQSQRQNGASSGQRRRAPLTEQALGGFGADPEARSTQRAGAVVSDQVRASMDAVILSSLQPCRRQANTAPPDAEVTRVRVQVTLNRDGSIGDLSTTVIGAGDTRYRNEYVRAAEQVARQCAQRLRRLAEDFPQFYEVRRGWRRFNYTFPA